MITNQYNIVIIVFVLIFSYSIYLAFKVMALLCTNKAKFVVAFDCRGVIS